MFNRLLFIVCVTLLLGMSSVPKQYTFDTTFNSQVNDKIKTQCIGVSANTFDSVQKCITGYSQFLHTGEK